MRSPRPSSATSYQSSSPRLSSPLNPSSSSFSPTGYTPRNSPVSEMSDVLSPLKECPEPGLISPRSRTSSLSRSPCSATSPERSPVVGPIPLQAHYVYAHHPSPSNSSFPQGIPFTASSLSSSSLAELSHPSFSRNPRPFSPSNSPRQGLPATLHSPHSHFQTRPHYPSPQPTQSHLHLHHGSPVHAAPSPTSRFPRTQSLIQQSFGSPYARHAPSSPPDYPRNRRVSLSAESRQHPPTYPSPMPAGDSFVLDTPAAIRGDSTPLNEAPIRWWGGRRGWLDDWESQSICDPYYRSTEPFDGAIAMGLHQPAHGNPLALREPFRRNESSPGAFLDDEIRASFDGAGGVGPTFSDLSNTGFVHTSMGVNHVSGLDGIPLSQALPMPVAPGVAGPRMRSDGLGYCEVDVGGLPIEGNVIMQMELDKSTHHYWCRSKENGNGLPHDFKTLIPDQAVGDGHSHEHTSRRSRGFSNASTHSSTSYVSCTSGPPQSQSQSLLMPSSQSRTGSPSLCSLGIGIEEAEREELRSRTFWRRRNSGSMLKRQSKDVGRGATEHGEEVSQACRTSRLMWNGENCGLRHVVDGGDPAEYSDADLKPSGSRVLHGDTTKHASFFARVGSRHGDASDEQAHQEDYSRAEKRVSMAILSILPPATIAMLSPVGEALVKTMDSARFIGHELAPVLKDTISVSADVLAFTPLPALEDAAKALLYVWDACQKVDTNRLSCLRLAERSATLLFSVRCDVDETGVQAALAEPVERLCSALAQIQTFLDTQLNRPFLKRYVRREEIARELQACNEAITDAASRFGLSVQIRTYREVYAAMCESKRCAQEAHALLSLDHQIIQRHYAMLFGQQGQTRRQEVVMEVTAENALGLTTDGTLAGTSGFDGGYPIPPPPAYGPPVQLPSTMASLASTMDKLTLPGLVSGRNTPTPLAGNPSELSVPPTPTLTKAAIVVEETKYTTTNVLATETEIPTTDVASAPMLMQALKEVHRAQDSVDAAADEAALRGTLTGALNAQNDMEMVRCLQVGRGEIPEAAETLRRMLGEGPDETRHVVLDVGEQGAGPSELDRKFMQSGIDAMMRLTNVVTEHPRGNENKGDDAVCAAELPNWTITRYEVIRTRKIGQGFFTDVYLGHWRKLDVVVKVLAHSVSRETFMRYIELWNELDHPNVLPLYGASSTLGEKPWFFVSKFCSGDDLVTSLRHAKLTGEMVVGKKTMVRVDLLRFMHEIAKGMAYLHAHGISHGDLRAANVLVDENGQCVLSDFGQCQIKSEAHRSCGQPESYRTRWKAPEMLMGDNRPTNAGDVYAYGMCCVEILGMGDLPWATLDNAAIEELVRDKDERPPIPDGLGNVTLMVANLVQSCLAREPDRRPSFSSIAISLEEARTANGVGPALLSSMESPPTDEQYETACESMTMEVESTDVMMDVSLTSPAPGLGPTFHVQASDHTEAVSISTQASTPEDPDDTPTTSPTETLGNHEIYRLIAGSNHAFHKSLTLPLWSPTHVELGTVGYVSTIHAGEFVILFNAIDPCLPRDQRLGELPHMQGFSKGDILKREEGKRSVAQRGFDAISGFLTFKTRGDRSQPERIARQFPVPLVPGEPAAHLYVEKTVHRYLDNLEGLKQWFKEHIERIVNVCRVYHPVERENLIMVTGTLDAPDWALFCSTDHAAGRTQFNVFANREKGEPWGMYTVEPVAKHEHGESSGSLDVAPTMFASKVSLVPLGGGNDSASDTVMLAGLQFKPGMEEPKEM